MQIYRRRHLFDWCEVLKDCHFVLFAGDTLLEFLESSEPMSADRQVIFLLQQIFILGSLCLEMDHSHLPPAPPTNPSPTTTLAFSLSKRCPCHRSSNNTDTIKNQGGSAYPLGETLLKSTIFSYKS